MSEERALHDDGEEPDFEGHMDAGGDAPVAALNDDGEQPDFEGHMDAGGDAPVT